MKQSRETDPAGTSLLHPFLCERPLHEASRTTRLADQSAHLPRRCRRRRIARAGVVAQLRILLRADLSGPTSTKSDRWSGVVNPLHFAPKAKRIIYLYMAGGPSHLETLDHKPTLARMHGQPMPGSFTAGHADRATPGAEAQLLRPAAPVPEVRASRARRSARSSPRSAAIADEICIIRSMVTEAINHDPAHTYMNTGTTISGRPAMGSWINYGLGSREPGSAGVRRAHVARQVRPGAADLGSAVASAVLAEPVPGGRVPLQGRPCPLRRRAPGDRPRAATRRGRCRPAAQLDRETGAR